MREEFDVRLVMGRVGFGLVSQGESPWTRYEFAILVGKDGGREQVAGHLEASKLSLGEVYRQRMPLWMAFDDYSSAAWNCYAAVFTNKGDIRKAFWDSQYDQEDFLLSDFHHLERIEIEEKFKGHGLAGIATQIYLENFASGKDVAYLKAFPLQCEARDEPYGRAFGGSEKECQQKLCGYYERLGFRRIGRSPHFFFVVDQFLDRRKERAEEEEVEA